MIRLVVRDIKTDREQHAFNSPVIPRVDEVLCIKDKATSYKVGWVQWHIEGQEVPCVYLWCHKEG